MRTLSLDTNLNSNATNGVARKLEPLEKLDIQISHVSTATPRERYRQKDIPDLFSFTHPTVKKFFSYDHIQYRHLYLPPIDPVSGIPVEESYGDLIYKFQKGALEIGGKALRDCLDSAGLEVTDVDYLCCVTSTGFTIPGLTANFIREFGLRNDCQRIDVVGMGCHAGLNGLNSVASWCAINPGKVAILLCVEICSAIYSIDDTPRTAIVNSLFGDGAVACLVGDHASRLGQQASPKILGFESQLIPSHWEELRFDWDDIKKRYSFYVGKDTPAATAAVADLPLKRLLDRFDLTQSDVSHWVVHGGGNAILVGMQKKLGLQDNDLRHTRSVLRDYGNVSSGSFLFSFQRLTAEGSPKRGDIGLMMTMGPGLTIELALIRWE